MVNVGNETKSEEGSILAKFIKVYAGLPIEERKRTIIVLSIGEPVNWEMAYREIKYDTPIGKEIAKKLLELKIIE